MRIRPLGAKLFHADGHGEANSSFRNFADAPKNAGERMATEFKFLGFLFSQSMKILKFLALYKTSVYPMSHIKLKITL